MSPGTSPYEEFKGRHDPDRDRKNANNVAAYFKLNTSNRTLHIGAGDNPLPGSLPEDIDQYAKKEYPYGEEELSGAIMRYSFDLTGNGMRRFGFFPEATAALTLPTERPDKLTLFVWGVILREPELDVPFCHHLRSDVRDALPNRLFLAGWGTVTFENICRGEVSVSPYRPVLVPGNHEFLTDDKGKPVTLSHVWPGPAGRDATEYLLSMVLEKPFGFMSLKVTTPGPVQLSIDPSDLVTEEQFLADPRRYAPDSERMRQLASVA